MKIPNNTKIRNFGEITLNLISEIGSIEIKNISIKFKYNTSKLYIISSYC